MKGRILVWDALQNDVFFTAGSLEKDVIFGGHSKQIICPFYFVRALVLSSLFIPQGHGKYES